MVERACPERTASRFSFELGRPAVSSVRRAIETRSRVVWKVHETFALNVRTRSRSCTPNLYQSPPTLTIQRELSTSRTRAKGRGGRDTRGLGRPRPDPRRSRSSAPFKGKYSAQVSYTPRPSLPLETRSGSRASRRSVIEPENTTCASSRRDSRERDCSLFRKKGGFERDACGTTSNDKARDVRFYVRVFESG